MLRLPVIPGTLFQHLGSLEKERDARPALRPMPLKLRGRGWHRSPLTDSGLNFPRDLRNLGGSHDLAAEHVVIVAKVDDKAGTHLVAFLDPLVAQADGQRIGLRIVGHLLGIRSFIYLSICEV